MLLNFPFALVPFDRQAAYAIQDKMAQLITADGLDKVVGWKVGATSSGVLAGIADNGNGGAIVVGPAIQEWQDISLMDLSVILSMNDGAAVKNLYGSSRGDPFDAFIWTVNSVYERGFDLHLGDYILTGSLTEPQFLQQGDQAIARYPNMGELSLIFS